MDDELRQSLLRIVEEDSRVREKLASDGSLFEDYHPWMEQVHKKNAEQLRAIIERNGWPGINLVGADGEEAAWRIAQHSIGEPEFMRDVLELLKSAATQHEAPLYQIALMEDRIRMFEGRLQIYGSSFDWDENGQMNPYPAIEQPESVNERRAAMGLPSLQEELERHRSYAEQAPRDPKKRRRQMEEWAISKGWRKVKS